MQMVDFSRGSAICARGQHAPELRRARTAALLLPKADPRNGVPAPPNPLKRTSPVPKRLNSRVLFDDSLPMQWNKRERTSAACKPALRRLRPADSFNLVLFNSAVNLLAP